MPNIKEPAAVTVSQVNVKFQAAPMEVMLSFTGEVSMPGVGTATAIKLLACNIKTPIGLLGQFMVHFLKSCRCCCACVCMYTLRRFLCAVVWQVLDCDKARMKTWLWDVAGVRAQEANMIVGALDEKCGKMLRV